MLIHLHSQATTTPKVRSAIQASDEAASVLAERYGTTEQTVYKWRHRDSVEDRSHTPHRLQTTLTPAQEAVAVALRRTLLVSLDDLLAVVREFLNPNASRSGLDRCLRRHGVGNLRDLKAKEPMPKHSAFKAYEPGYIHIDVKYLPQMADERSRRYLFVAIDRAKRWVFIRVFETKTAANARRFLRDLERACPLRIRTVLTDEPLNAMTEPMASKRTVHGHQQSPVRRCRATPCLPWRVFLLLGMMRNFNRVRAFCWVLLQAIMAQVQCRTVLTPDHSWHGTTLLSPGFIDIFRASPT